MLKDIRGSLFALQYFIQLFYQRRHTWEHYSLENKTTLFRVCLNNLLKQTKDIFKTFLGISLREAFAF